MTHYVFVSDWAWPSIEDVDMLEAHENGEDVVTVVVRESTSPCALNPFKTEDKISFFSSHGLHAVSMQLLPYQTITKNDIITELRKNGAIYWPENTKILSKKIVIPKMDSYYKTKRQANFHLALCFYTAT